MRYLLYQDVFNLFTVSALAIYLILFLTILITIYGGGAPSLSATTLNVNEWNSNGMQSGTSGVGLTLELVTTKNWACGRP
ncbi:hypothetical protein H2248_002062 [Termitomyces sp. 'cryptogamus']|nr:hypothetical protein H2248_002062 [Termitomyces sp. 'cryptogamus']